MNQCPWRQTNPGRPEVVVTLHGPYFPFIAEGFDHKNLIRRVGSVLQERCKLLRYGTGVRQDIFSLQHQHGSCPFLLAELKFGAFAIKVSPKRLVAQLFQILRWNTRNFQDTVIAR